MKILMPGGTEEILFYLFEEFWKRFATENGILYSRN
jgi:uncharacterized membrane protein